MIEKPDKPSKWALSHEQFNYDRHFKSHHPTVSAGECKKIINNFFKYTIPQMKQAAREKYKKTVQARREKEGQNER